MSQEARAPLCAPTALVVEAERLLSRAPRRAAALARAALVGLPRSARAQHVLGEALARTGAVAEGAALLRRAVRADGRLADLSAADAADAADDGTAWIGRFEAVACPVCRSTDSAPVWAGNLSRVHALHGHLDPVRVWCRCADCGVTRVERPAPPAALAAWQAAQAGAPAAPPPEGVALSERLVHHDALIARIREVGHGDDWLLREGGEPPQPALLEVGCGWGDFLAAAQWRGFEVVGLEEVPARSRWASERLGVEVHAGDAAQGVPEGPFDVVVVRAPLGTLPRPVRALRALTEQLAPEGLVVLEVHTLDHPVHQLRGADDPIWADPARRTWFDRASLGAVLGRAGLEATGAWHAEGDPGAATIFARPIATP